MTTQNQAATDVPGGDPAQVLSSTTPSEASPIAATAKMELKEGRVMVDGKKFVAESDLIAAKESLEKQMRIAQTTHNNAVDAAKLETSEANKQVAILNARIQENEQARQAGVVSEEEATRVKQELETTKGSIETLTNNSLGYRRELMQMRYGISAETIVAKNHIELDSFEEAIKAVSTAKGGGVGPYALGGGGTGDAAPQTDIERATKLLESTPYRGVHNAPAT